MASDTRETADLPESAPAASRFALVMSGGGARGAYEAGVLRWVLDELPGRLGRTARFDIVTGTSVGAIHACYVGATVGRAGAGAELVDIWKSLELGSVYRFGVTDLVRVPLRLLGLNSGRRPPPGPGLPERLGALVDALPLERIVRDRIPWADLRRNVDAGDVEVAVAATEVASGKTVVWIDNREHAVTRWAHDPFVIARPASLHAAHALASAAIPLLFPALRIDGRFYCDGGLRLNTPLAPALRLGADRLLIVGVRYVTPPSESPGVDAEREAGYGSLVYLFGKVLNALLLDHVEYDVDRLRVVNAILDTGTRIYGPEFLRHINETVASVRGTEYRVVKNIYLTPSRDLGVVAAECLDQHHPAPGLRARLSRAALQQAVRGVVAEADLLSYLFFDRCYAEHLTELGWADAEAHSEELIAFFRDE
jgi:NTE family protein